MTWEARVVAHLCECKAAGVPFQTAWNRAMVLHPPRGRDLGPERPQLWKIPELSVVDFFHAAADDAWHGRRPALQHFHPSLLMERDGTGPAVRTRRLAA